MVKGTFTTYEKVKGFITSNECELLTSEHDYTGTKGKIFVKYKCGHEGETTFNLVYRKCTNICASCVHESYKKDSYAEQEKAPLMSVQEGLVRQTIETHLTNNGFEVAKTHEACLADLIVKPKGSTNNMWLPVQLKTSVRKNTAQHSFNRIHKYKGMLLLLIYFEDFKLEKIWLMNGSLFTNQQTLTMGKVNSRYSYYEIGLDDLPQTIHRAYESTSYNNLPLTLQSTEAWNTPSSPANRTEHIHRMKRESLLSGYFKFTYPQVDGCITDCYIDGVKIQDKPLVTCPRGFCNVRFGRSYFVGDNDLYWVYSSGGSQFFIFPQTLLMEIGLFDTSSGHSQTNLYIGRLDNNNYENYMFDYNNLDIPRLQEIIAEAKRNEACVS